MYNLRTNYKDLFNTDAELENISFYYIQEKDSTTNHEIVFINKQEKDSINKQEKDSINKQQIVIINEQKKDSIKLRTLLFRRDSLSKRRMYLNSKIDTLLCEIDSANNEVMEAKIEEVDRSVTLWVTILCGVATIVALCCSIAPMLSYKEIKDEINGELEKMKNQMSEIINESNKITIVR